MKRNISDLLDHCVPEELELGGGAYYDPRRIKQLTMERAVGAAPRKKKVRPFRLLAVAAAVCALSVSALAVGHMMGAGDLFRTFFAGTEGTLSEGQITAIDRVGMTFEGGRNQQRSHHHPGGRPGGPQCLLPPPAGGGP